MNYLQQILNKAESLYMKIGIKSVSMDDLAKRLGISKKTLYQFVENKSDLVSKICQNHVLKEKAAIAEIKENSDNAIDEMLKISRYVISQMRDVSPTTIFDLKKYYPKSWHLFEEYNNGYIYQHISQNIERGKQEKLYRSDVNVDIIARMYVSQSFVLVDENVFPLREYSREQLFEQFMTQHIRGIACPEGVQIFEELLNNK